MAFRTWGRLLLTALGVSLLAGAGQLGIAYGFGIVGFARVFSAGTANQWPAQLTWVGWFAAVAAVIGAVLADRLTDADDVPGTPGVRAAVAGAAALGATVVAPLCMLPARAAEVTSADPVPAVALAALLGAVVGFLAAFGVLNVAPLGWNLVMVGAALWFLALFSVASSLDPGDPVPAVRLGALDPAWLAPGAAQRLAILVLPTLALLAGAATGGLARWRGEPPLVSVGAGLIGPALVALAYLGAGQGTSVDRYQAAPFWGALIAVAAGALGSGAATVLRWPLIPAPTGTPGTLAPTDILRPLPASPDLPSTAAARTADGAAGPIADSRPEPLTVGTTATPTGPDLTAPTAPDLATTTGPDLTAPTAPDLATTTGPDLAAPTGPASTWAVAPATGAPKAPAVGVAVPAPASVPLVSAPAVGVTAPVVASSPEPTETGPAPTPASPATSMLNDPDPASDPAPTNGPAPTSSTMTGPAATPGAGRIAPAPEPGGPADSVGTTDVPPVPKAARRAGRGTSAAAEPSAPKARRKAVSATPATAAPPPPTVDAPTPNTAATPQRADADADPATPHTAHHADAATPRTADVDAAVEPVRATRPEPEPVVLPQSRPGLPVLGREPNWDAFAAARRDQPGPGPAAAHVTGPQAQPSPGPGAEPERTGEPQARFGVGSDPDRPVGPADRVGTERRDDAGSRTGADRPAASLPWAVPAAPPGPTPQPFTWPTNPRPGGAVPVQGGSGRPVPAASDAVDPDVPVTGVPTAAGGQPTLDGQRTRRGLFRRTRKKDVPEDSAGRERDEPPLPAHDEEYVDWVTGLSRPVLNNEPEPDSAHRSLRSTGRHHRE